MPDETKPPSSSPPEGEPKPSVDKPAVPGGVKATASGSGQSDPKSSTEKAAGVPPAPAAPAAPVAKAEGAAPPAAGATPHRAAAPAKPAAPTVTPWESPMIEKLKTTFGSGIEPLTYLGQNYMVVDQSLIPEILQILRDEEKFDYCEDVTAVHYPQREKQFDVVWVLYAFSRNERIRVKTQIKDGETLASSVAIWPTANWLEREV
ncbi:MAG TPA: NADH-quinone oxidoreductase subunit C [Candidatus Binatia bacterium]|nr:NADH-quinone oxidoreductase subunit C [Candidatus Binatia bacterium]